MYSVVGCGAGPTIASDRMRQLTCRSRLGLPVEWIVEYVNMFLRGWAGFFKYGNSARHFEKIRYYAKMRLALVISKRHKRSREFGWSVLSFQSSNEWGLIGLGTVVAPRPFKPWRRDKPNAGGERRR